MDSCVITISSACGVSCHSLTVDHTGFLAHAEDLGAKSETRSPLIKVPDDPNHPPLMFMPNSHTSLYHPTSMTKQRSLC